MAEIEKQLEENLAINTSEIKSKIKENQIFIGNKPFMRYIRSAEILFRNKNLKSISIRARGMCIGKAVDLAEAVKNKFCADLKLDSSVLISTEKFMKEDREFSVSVIEINLKR
jgi:DNA-binding protein Alba